MNLRKYKRAYRLVSLTTIFSLMLSVLGMVVTPKQVEAQTQAPMLVGVIDFRNESGIPSDLYARFATDAVVIELSKSNQFDVITRRQMQAAMDDLSLHPPFSQVEMRRLGESLAAESLIEGSVKSIELLGTGASRQATVIIVVRMIDQASGETINGGVQTGASNARVGYTPDDDKLIEEAINNAAYLAVKTMIDYIIPEATILSTIRSDEVMLNKGARDGIRTGMRMIVTREGEIIGKLKVQKVDPSNAEAVVVESSRGIQPEDKARAVFDMPAVEEIPAGPAAKTMTPRTKQGTGKGIGKIKDLLVGLIGLGLLAMMFTKSGEQVGSISAEAGLSSFDLPVESGTPGVRIKWDRNKLSRGLNVIEYHVWRNDVPGPVLVGRPSDGEVFDDAQARAAVKYQFSNPDDNSLDSGTTAVPAMTLGRSMKYFVSALYKVIPVGAADPLYFETERKPTGQATPIAQIKDTELRKPLSGSQQNLNKIEFKWFSRRGADVYVVEASTDPTFRNPEYVGSQVTFIGPDFNEVTSPVTSKLASAFPDVASDQPIWWRVGARASSDSPGPIPAYGDSSRRYIYSEVSSFFAIELPPPNP